jgi:hypothetical protein
MLEYFIREYDRRRAIFVHIFVVNPNLHSRRLEAKSKDAIAAKDGVSLIGLTRLGVVSREMTFPGNIPCMR